jgi:uncharacterized protein YndB with AHSA1/START domain
MDDAPPPLPPLPHRRWIIWLVGIVASNVLMAIVYGGVVFLIKQSETKDLGAALGLPSFFLVPLFGGLLASFFWRRLLPSVGETLLNTLFVTLVLLTGAVIVFQEGAICLIMASPLLFGMVLTGTLLGRLWFKANSSHLRVTVLPLLALLVAGEPFVRSDLDSVVVDEVLIHAPPERVWPYVTSFPAIPEPPRFWLFKLGLPYPMETTSAGDFIGADRRCIFSGGAVFKEIVSEIEPARKLTFDIIESPADPELIGHLTPLRGQFILRDNRDGTTTLIGSSWYRLHVRPLRYFEWWAEHACRAVHLRVMEDVRRRAEMPPSP